MTEIVDRVKPHASRWYASAHWAFVLIEIAPGKTVVVAENKAAKRSMINDDFAWDTSGLGAMSVRETRWLSLMSALLVNSGTRRRSENVVRSERPLCFLHELPKALQFQIALGNAL